MFFTQMAGPILNLVFLVLFSRMYFDGTRVSVIFVDYCAQT